MSSSVFASGQPTRAALAYLRGALPSSWLGGSDGFAAYVAYRAELRALAYRSGIEAGLQGTDLAGAIARSLDAVPAEDHEQAISAALQAAFREPFAALAQSVRTAPDTLILPVQQTGFQIPLGRILLALLAVPTDIARLGYGVRIAPAAGVAGALKQGGARRELAIAQIGLGGIAALTLADLAIMGRITGRGPSSPALAEAWRRAGHLPWSIRTGATWSGYDRNGMLGVVVAMVADTITLMKLAADADRSDAATSLILGAGEAMLSTALLGRLARLFDALNAAGDADALLAAFAGPPGDGRLVSLARQHEQLLDALESKLPVVAQGLPPARTLWGDPIAASQALKPPLAGASGEDAADATEPAEGGTPSPDATPTPATLIDRWIAAHRALFAKEGGSRSSLSPPGPVQTFSAGPQLVARARLTPAQHDRFQMLAGHAERDPQTGLGARDSLDALVAGRHPDIALQRQWHRASPDGRAQLVQTIVNTFRDRAKQRLTGEFPALGEALSAGWQNTAGPAKPAAKP